MWLRSALCYLFKYLEQYDRPFIEGKVLMVLLLLTWHDYSAWSLVGTHVCAMRANYALKPHSNKDKCPESHHLTPSFFSITFFFCIIIGYSLVT
jgi:hypothetical protein